MPRLPSDLRESQRLIVERIKATTPKDPVSNERIAEVAGVSATMVSKWISPTKDGREMKWGELRRLADVFGWDVVFGRAASAKGYRIAKPRTKAPPDPVGVTLEMTGAAVDATQVVREAMADGRIDAHERPMVQAALAKVIERAETAGAVGEA